jgi:hypothetical protein
MNLLIRTYITAFMLVVTLGLVSCGGGNDGASTETKSTPLNAQMTIGNGGVDFYLFPKQALFFDYTSTVSYGGVNSLTIGGITLIPNLSMAAINNPRFESTNIVGPFTSVVWEGEATSPLNLVFLIDTTNKDALLKLISAGVPDTAVSINFAVGSPSSSSESLICSLYYTPFWTNDSTISGNVIKSAAATYLKVETTPYAGISSPVLYEAHLRISPLANVSYQTLYLQSSCSSKWVESWGI